MAVIPYPFRVADNYGSLVAGATIVIGAVTLTTPLTAYSVPAGVSLATGATLNGSTGPSVEYVDYGTGDYALLYDTETFGEAYFPLTVSKSGSTITGDNALQPVFATKDSTRIVTALPNGSLPTDTSVQADAAAAIAATTPLNSAGVGTLLTRVPGTVQPQTGDSYARIGAPANASVSADIAAVEGHAANADSQSAALPSASTIATAVGGRSLQVAPTTGTWDEAMASARSGFGLGKVVYTPPSGGGAGTGSVTVYAHDGVTVLHTFSDVVIDSFGNNTNRS